MAWWDKYETIATCNRITEQIVLHENNQPERSKREDSIKITNVITDSSKLPSAKFDADLLSKNSRDAVL